MNIGILSRNFAAKRLFLNKIDGAEYKNVRFCNLLLWKNIHLLILKAFHVLHMSPEELVAKVFYDFYTFLPTGCNVFHFFNCINHSATSPWVISVESGVPWSVDVTRCVESEDADLSRIKDNPYVLSRIKNLASDNCLGLLALSKCSENIQRAIISQFPKYEKYISDKLITLHPSQTLIVKNIEEKGLAWQDDEQFVFIYVGKNYYRKGGRESVQILSKLHKKYDFKLILISAMEVDEQRYMRSEQDEEDALKLIGENKDWIEFHKGLPNAEVVEKLKLAHVCLLPTWMDTYAYSVLESQACGTPLITTSLRALTEINSEEVGWLIDVPVNSLNNPLHLTKVQQDIFSDALNRGLEEKIEYVLTHRDEVKAKSFKCLERIAKYHTPEEYNRKLQMIYEGKIGDLIKSGK